MFTAAFRKLSLMIRYKKQINCRYLQMKKHADIKITGSGSIYCNNALLNSNTFICSSGKGIINIGKNVSINRNSIIVIKERLDIGDDCSIGPNVCIYDHDHVYDTNGFRKVEFNTDSISIGRNVWIGANVVILKGTCIGNNCVIGAGVILKGSIPDNSIVTSNREIIIKELH